MTSRIDRRSFLQIIVVTASAPGLFTACDSDDVDTGPSTDPAEQKATYPQGVASGDPKAESVILWTRVEPGGAVTYEVATDAAFGSIVAQGDVSVDDSTDNTLRLKVEGLSPYTHYYYRFLAQNVLSVTGRTKTAPAADQDQNVRFAFASCQDYNGRYYHPYKALLEEPDIDFILHIGDYIYETEGDPRFQDPGETRRVILPDGLEIGHEPDLFHAALTLADYRHIYKTFRSDEDLQRVHQMFPFICIWDDHEFADDSWQDHSTHFNEEQGDEKDSARRQAATQAWFEYMCADVEHTAGAAFPDDIVIYRSLNYGQHVDIIITDQRYYRDDHLIPEGPPDVAMAKTGVNTSLGSRFFLPKDAFDMREAAAAPTMLGDTQKQWFIDTMNASTATWKFWANETQLAQHAVDLSGFPSVPAQFQTVFYIEVDQWDGFSTERTEVLTAISGVENVVALTGDIHAFYAVEVQADYDAPAAPVCVEYVTAGISSRSIYKIAERIISASETFMSFGVLDLLPQMDDVIKSTGPHYKYANSDTNGISIVDVTAAEITVTFLHTGDPLDEGDTGVKERTVFKTASGSNTVTPA